MLAILSVWKKVVWCCVVARGGSIFLLPTKVVVLLLLARVSVLVFVGGGSVSCFRQWWWFCACSVLVVARGGSVFGDSGGHGCFLRVLFWCLPEVFYFRRRRWLCSVRVLFWCSSEVVLFLATVVVLVLMRYFMCCTHSGCTLFFPLTVVVMVPQSFLFWLG
jgi:hypothetical protein